MTKEQKEAIIWLMLEYRSHREQLNVAGISALLELSKDYDIDKAEELLLGEGEEND